jgi:thiol-disulfide isomerase/thioredoxin
MLLVVSPAIALTQARKAPDFVLKDIRGRSVRLSSYKGKIVLLNFWATWCPPCRAEMPELVTWQREYRARGLQVIGVTYPPTNRTEVRRFVRRIKTNYPIVLGRKEIKALFYEGETLPITVVIDREGNIRETIEGILLPEEFEEKIRPLFEQSNGDRNHHSTLKNRFMGPRHQSVRLH